MTGQDKLPPPRRAQLKRLRHPISKDILDHALTFWLPGPHSFTGEDSAELQIHGGYAVTKAVLAALGSIPGLAPAQAGDFTKRAFHAGKLDLTQVEALADLIHAETDHQRRQALRQLDGNLMKQFELWRTRLIKIMANIEAYIDFAESEDIEETIPKEVHKNILELLEELKLSHKNAKSGERLRKGVHVAIVGKPNVGKSTLLNRIVQRPAAIVSPLAGTTRDVVETRLDLQGYPVVLFDTAGLREETNDIVEEEGVKRAINTGNSADILILVQDATSGNENRTENFDLKEFGLEDIGQVKLNLMNKIDLNNNSHDSTAFGVSGLTGKGLDEFLDVLTDHVKELCETKSGENCPGLTRDRHKFHLSKAIGKKLIILNPIINWNNIQSAIGPN